MGSVPAGNGGSLYLIGTGDTLGSAVWQPDPFYKSAWESPFTVTASQHYYAQTLMWFPTGPGQSNTAQDQDYVQVSYGTHPNIYVAEGSHALYFRAGTFNVDFTPHFGTQIQYSPPFGVVNDVTVDNTLPPYNLTPIAQPTVNGQNTDMRLNWLGLWGDSMIPFQNPNGPESPAYRYETSGDSIINMLKDPASFNNNYLKGNQTQYRTT